MAAAPASWAGGQNPAYRPPPAGGTRRPAEGPTRRGVRGVLALPDAIPARWQKATLTVPRLRVYRRGAVGRGGMGWWSLGSGGDRLQRVGCSEATTNMRSMTRVGS